ncbi:hypothetical protein EDD85DRAFT_796615 [Armillaria nabsnona]|nr:hypothetical protein EDD85DRAFT_796615 [Armillaria nabsnona]
MHLMDSHRNSALLLGAKGASLDHRMSQVRRAKLAWLSMITIVAVIADSTLRHLEKRPGFSPFNILSGFLPNGAAPLPNSLPVVLMHVRLWRISSLKVVNGSVSLANGHSAGCATSDDDVEDIVHVLFMCPQDTVSSAKRNTIGSTPRVYTGNELIPRFTTLPLAITPRASHTVHTRAQPVTKLI